MAYCGRQLIKKRNIQIVDTVVFFSYIGNFTASARPFVCRRGGNHYNIALLTPKRAEKFLFCEKCFSYKKTALRIIISRRGLI
jgi:hypothetical protein